MPQQMGLYQLIKPQKWLAGSVGGKPIYFDCCTCDALEPVIHGFQGTGPTFLNVGIIRDERGSFKTAMYCGPCWERLCRDSQAVFDEPAALREVRGHQVHIAPKGEVVA